MRKALVVLTILCATRTGFADIVRYDGVDPGAGPSDPRPNSDAAAAAFDVAAGALGTIETVDFEGLPLGYFGPLEVYTGVTAWMYGADPPAGIADETWFSEDVPRIHGYNTTAGGAQFLGVVPELWMPPFPSPSAVVRFEFDTSVRAFGTYLTGLGTAGGALHAEFFDGDSQDLEVSGHPEGGALFFGFTDTGASISRVTLQLTRNFMDPTRDIFGIDDLRFVSVPEPATLSLLALGAVLVTRRR